MSKLFEKIKDHTKEHRELDHKDGWVICTWCEKKLEERATLPDYGIFMGPVWAKQNLPCKPYPGEERVETHDGTGEAEDE